MCENRDDGRRAAARQRADAFAYQAETLLSGPFANAPDASLAVRMAICHALLAIYSELHHISEALTASSPRPATAALSEEPRFYGCWASEPGA